jgi:hypothetical protein
LRTPTINHAHGAFTENKRWRAKPRQPDDVVNQNGDFVYQTDAVFALSDRVQSAAPATKTV